MLSREEFEWKSLTENFGALLTKCTWVIKAFLIWNILSCRSESSYIYLVVDVLFLLDLWNVFTFKIIISFSLSLLVSIGHIIECPVMRFYSIHNCIYIIMIHWHTSHWIRYITDCRIRELSCLNLSFGWWIGKELKQFDWI